MRSRTWVLPLAISLATALGSADAVAGDLVTLNEQTLVASDAAAFDTFGASVAVSGGAAVVGAPGDAGFGDTAYVFVRSDGLTDTWEEAALLVPSDADGGWNHYGHAVSIWGDTAVVGAWGKDGMGAAYVFQRDHGGADAWGEVVKLTAPKRTPDDVFGISVAISGDTILVGAAGDDDGGDGTGSAHLFERDAGGADAWGHVATLHASDAAAGDAFGLAVALSGDRALIGTPWKQAVYLFERDAGGAGSWGQVAQTTPADVAAGDNFGAAVALAGDLALVGAPGNDEVASDAGAAYLFGENEGGAGAWGPIAKLTDEGVEANAQLGRSVALRGGLAFAGAAYGSAGVAYLFGPDPGGTGSWVVIDKLADDGAVGLFGYAVAVSGASVLVGAPTKDGTGAVVAFDLVGETLLAASDGAADDYFGIATAVSGDHLIVGAWSHDGVGSDSGAAYVFARNAGGPGAWGEVAKLTASDASAFAHFGSAVAIDGPLAVVGADQAGVGGAAYLFGRDEGGPGAWGEVTRLTGSDTGGSDFFGAAVAVAGDTVLVGAVGHDAGGSEAGAAYVFARDQGGADAWGEVAKLTAYPPAPFDLFGLSVAVSGDTAIVGVPWDDDPEWGEDSGSAYVFQRDFGGADTWGGVEKLTPERYAPSGGLGSSASISGDTAVVGAKNDSELGFDAGAAYVFERNVGGADRWGQVARLTASDGASEDQFGHAVSIEGDRLAVGSPNDDDRGDGSGSVYVFRRNAGGLGAWGPAAKLLASEGSASDSLGHSVALSEDVAVAGSSGDDAQAGSVRVFDLLPACDDGFDDDADGWADRPLDPGCAGSDDLSERSPLLVCDDGADNDGDGLADFHDADGDGISDPPADPACRHPGFERENSRCQDGVNDDGAIGTDYDGGESILGAGNGDPDGPDPQCVGQPWVNTERAPSSCGLGPEPALLLGVLAAVGRRRRRGV